MGNSPWPYMGTCMGQRALEVITDQCAPVLELCGHMHVRTSIERHAYGPMGLVATRHSTNWLQLLNV
eukprot:scaffold145467_cov18-Tisochrysis_lutea.AAC.1